MNSRVSQRQDSVQPVSSNVERNHRNIERDLGNIDQQLVKLIRSVKKDSSLYKALESMESEIKHLIADLRKPKKGEDLGEILKKLEEELEELKGKTGKLSESEKEVLDNIQGQIAAVTQQLTLAQQAQESALKETGSLSGVNTSAEVSKTIQLIQKMCERIQVGTVGGVTFTSIDMKNTTEVPSYFVNANITITPDITGKMTIQFSNMTQEQQAAAIAAIQQHPELLLDLLNRVPIDRLQIGDQTITLPQSEREEGRERGDREGGGREQREREGEEQ